MILEELCRELKHLRHVEIDADQYIWDGDVNSYVTPDSRNWGKVEQLVEEMRAILQERDPTAVVRLFEWVSSRRLRETAMDSGEVIREEMREYVKSGEYVDAIGRARGCLAQACGSGKRSKSKRCKRCMRLRD